METPAPSDERIVVTAVAVEGNTVYATEELAPLYEGLLATSAGVEDIRKVAARITEKYRADGYFLSQAFLPAQSGQFGIVRIRIVEGFFEEVQFSGSEKPAGVMARLADALKDARPLKLQILESAILLIGDAFGYRVRDAAVEPIDELAGRYRLKLDLSYDRTFHAIILDNRGTEEAGRPQLWTGFGVNDVLIADTRIQAGLFTVPTQPQELRYLELQASRILNTAGTTLTALVSDSTSDVGGSEAQFDTESTGRKLSVRASHPVRRTRELSLWVSGIADIAAYDKEALGQPVFDDQLRVGRLGANLFARDDLGGTNRLMLELSHGFDVLGASSEAGLRSRFGASGVFTKLRADASRTQSIVDNVWLELQLAGQVSADELLSSEEFSLGGTYIGRAYDFSELTGDHGLGGSLELRYGRDLDDETLKGFQTYAFYDAGMVWNMGAFEDDRAALASAGLGIRLVLTNSVRLNLEFARALTRPVNTDGDKVQRLFFRLSQGF